MCTNELSLIENLDVNAINKTLQKVRSLQATLKSILTENYDYGKIQGCGDKPTLLKPGAEKILMALGVTSCYELVEHTEDFNGIGFFAHTVKCVLYKGENKITEGLGHANSKEAKWAYEWVSEKDLPEGAEKSILKKRVKNGQYGSYTQYRVDADANSKANTILKMAKKRAQIDAVLTVASLSEIFTQDFDDLPPVEEPTTKPIVESVKKEAKEKAAFVCSKCGKEISEKVYNYSLDNLGFAACYECQKKPVKDEAVEEDLSF